MIYFTRGNRQKKKEIKEKTVQKIKIRVKRRYKIFYDTCGGDASHEAVSQSDRSNEL